MISKDKTLCLVDGSGYIFRAFYALPPMNRPDGTPVNAVYGFTNMMLNLIHDNCCSHMVVILDAKRKNFRNDIYPEYKANRQETPPDLIPQFPLIRAACDALNVPWLEMEGFEADDLIATYARLATEKGWHATVISADKDLMQLMTPDVSLYDPMKKKMLTQEDVKNKFGVTPDKVVDVQSLMGDSTDNIPGAAGIGPKTAAELIQKFGSLHNLLDHLDEVPQQKRREGLIRDKEQILISEKLVSLDKHAPVKPDFEPFAVHPYNTPELATFLTQNGFQSLIKRLQIHTPQPTITIPKPDKTTYVCIQHPRDLRTWAHDVQTLALYPVTLPKTDHLIGLALAKEIGNACYIPLDHKGTDDMPALDLFSADNRPMQLKPAELGDILIPILQNKKITKIGHDIKMCWHLLAQFIDKDFTCTPLTDTQLMSYDLDGTKHAHELNDIAPLYLKQQLSPTPPNDAAKSHTSFDEIPLDQATSYAAERADMTLRLCNYLTKQIENTPTNQVYTDIDLPLVSILYQMEKEGILVDQNRLRELNDLFGCRLDALTKEIYQIAGEEFNINSPAQLGVILFEKRGLSGGKRGANGHWITDVKVLETLAADNNDTLAQKVLQYRSVSKLKSTYVDALIERAEKTPRIHTTYSLTATNTGRL
ncbi:MAG: DNA polymerase I, partial [Alphaproteobacteria bacterium]|nr:DNA polymerase I [Alphaproteobacteria bacterium]